MLNYVDEFVNQILKYGNFKRTEISDRAYNQLLMETEKVSKGGIVTIPSLINRYKFVAGELIIDDTDNPKYGLTEIAIKMKKLSTGGYHKGYKIVLFLWRMEDKTIPFAFGLYHKKSKSLCKIAMDICSTLRNQFKVKPKLVLADGIYNANYFLNRLDIYGRGFVVKGKRTTTLNGVPFRKAIPRGYGSKIGKLSNGVKVKVVRRKNRFFITNRVSMNDEEVLAAYDRRWKIEEVFRFMKGCFGLDRCQQHSIKAQELYLYMVFGLYSIFERIKKGSIYKAFSDVILGNLQLDKSIMQEIFAM